MLSNHKLTAFYCPAKWRIVSQCLFKSIAICLCVVIGRKAHSIVNKRDKKYVNIQSTSKLYDNRLISYRHELKHAVVRHEKRTAARVLKSLITL
jgi:hypothetical protein